MHYGPCVCALFSYCYTMFTMAHCPLKPLSKNKAFLSSFAFCQVLIKQQEKQFILTFWNILCAIISKRHFSLYRKSKENCELPTPAISLCTLPSGCRGAGEQGLRQWWIFLNTAGMINQGGCCRGQFIYWNSGAILYSSVRWGEEEKGQGMKCSSGDRDLPSIANFRSHDFWEAGSLVEKHNLTDFILRWDLSLWSWVEPTPAVFSERYPGCG